MGVKWLPRELMALHPRRRCPPDSVHRQWPQRLAVLASEGAGRWGTQV